MAGRKKGTPKTGGRKTGTPNRIGATIRDSLIEVFDDLGGVEHMKAWVTSLMVQFKLFPNLKNGSVLRGQVNSSLWIICLSLP